MSPWWSPRISKTWILPSFYSEEKHRMSILERYKNACERAVTDKSLEPSDVDGDGIPDTKCNWGVQQICRSMGYRKFDGKIANDIYDYVTTANEWVEASTIAIVDRIKKGLSIGIAVQRGREHGHVAMIYPGPLVSSGKWKSNSVPLVANVGKANGVVGANFAFRDEPRYFYKDMA